MAVTRRVGVPQLSSTFDLSHYDQHTYDYALNFPNYLIQHGVLLTIRRFSLLLLSLFPMRHSLLMSVRTKVLGVSPIPPLARMVENVRIELLPHIQMIMLLNISPIFVSIIIYIFFPAFLIFLSIFFGKSSLNHHQQKDQFLQSFHKEEFHKSTNQLVCHVLCSK